MKPLKLALSLNILAILGITFGCSNTPKINNIGETASTPPAIEHSSGQSAPVFISSYVYTPFDEMVKSADVIFLGQITHIGETKWNQDSGEYWQETIKDEFGETIVPALPYFEVTISPVQMIVNTLDIEGPVVVTVLEHSPLDSLGGEFDLKIGDEIITFVSQSEIAWYFGEVTYNNSTKAFESGRKTVLLFTAAPNQSSLMKNNDGSYQLSTDMEQVGPFSLDELISLIEEKRGAP